MQNDYVLCRLSGNLLRCIFHKANLSYAEGVLGNSVMVAQMTLDHLVKVRILVPQWFDAADGFLAIYLAHHMLRRTIPSK